MKDLYFDSTAIANDNNNVFLYKFDEIQYKMLMTDYKTNLLSTDILILTYEEI